jgi:N-acetylneuraminic acid mutarotase
VLHSATLLRNGEVLVVGGRLATANLGSAERYNPLTNQWRPAASMTETESALGAVLLASGKVFQSTLSGEIYDPDTDTWTLSYQGSTRPSAIVAGNAAVLLPDGRVLVTGGVETGGVVLGVGEVLRLPSTSGIYDPIARSWAAVTVEPALYCTVTALQTGNVLVVGGITTRSILLDAAYFVSTGEVSLFDAQAGAWSKLGSHAHSGADAAGVVLSDGRVVVAGGALDRQAGRNTNITAAVDILGTDLVWKSAAPMAVARQGHSATLMGNGQMLVAGGSDGGLIALASAERYDPVANSWTPAGAMSSPRIGHTASALQNGKVLVTGGDNRPDGCSCTSYFASADLYDPSTNTWSSTGSLLTARSGHTATVLPNGKVLVAGGFGGASSPPGGGGGVIISIGGGGTNPPAGGGAPSTPVGGAGSVLLSSAEIYDPVTGKWSAAAAMTQPRVYHTATLLPSGRVLVVGGGAGTVTNTAEMYDPATDQWTTIASMSTAREQHLATILPDGRVLVVGGINDTASAVFGVSNGEIYDPLANTWSSAGQMRVPRQHFVLAPLPDGRIMLEGGLPNRAGPPEYYK